MRPIVGTTDRRITFSSLTTAALPRIARLGLGRTLCGFFRVFRAARLSSSVPKPSAFVGWWLVARLLSGGDAANVTNAELALSETSAFFGRWCFFAVVGAVVVSAETSAFVSCCFLRFRPFRFCARPSAFVGRRGTEIGLLLTLVYIFRSGEGRGEAAEHRAVGGSLSRGVKGTSLNNPFLFW